jgi:hypothetical protein
MHHLTILQFHCQSICPLSPSAKPTDRHKLHNLAKVQNLLQLPTTPSFCPISGAISGNNNVHNVPNIHNVQGSVFYTFPKVMPSF